MFQTPDISSRNWITRAKPGIRTARSCLLVALRPMCEILITFNGGNLLIIAIEVFPFKMHCSKQQASLTTYSNGGQNFRQTRDSREPLRVPEVPKIW